MYVLGGGTGAGSPGLDEGSSLKVSGCRGSWETSLHGFPQGPVLRGQVHFPQPLQSLGRACTPVRMRTCFSTLST